MNFSTVTLQPGPAACKACPTCCPVSLALDELFSSPEVAFVFNNGKCSKSFGSGLVSDNSGIKRNAMQ